MIRVQLNQQPKTPQFNSLSILGIFFTLASSKFYDHKVLMGTFSRGSMSEFSFAMPNILLCINSSFFLLTSPNFQTKVWFSPTKIFMEPIHFSKNLVTATWFLARIYHWKFWPVEFGSRVLCKICSLHITVIHCFYFVLLSIWYAVASQL